VTVASIVRCLLRRDRALAWAAVLAAGASGCASAGGQRAPGGLHGSVVDPPWPRPHITLVATDGRPFDFFEATKGTLTLVLFGYTNCPDVCPVHLSTIAAVKSRLTGVEANRMKVIFITTDPERDTPDVMQRWLNAIDRDVIGLRGTEEEIGR
jgi:protein SCO1/2